jgi:protease-4
MKRTGSLFYRPRPRTKEISQKRWHWPSIIGRAVRRACLVVGGVVLFSALAGVVLSFMMRDKSGALPSDMILVFNLSEGVTETAFTPSLLDPFPFETLTVRDFTAAIDRAAKDPRVHGFVLNVDGGAIDPAHTEELRAAIARFRAAGKKTKVFSPSFADAGGTGLGTYYLASAFEEIWMQPVGMLSLAGVNMETPFIRGLLDKVGVRPDFLRREEYKNAMETFTDKTMSEPSRVMMQSIVADLAGRMMAQIFTARKMDAPGIKQLIDQGIFTGEGALQAKLIDRLDYGDVMVSEWRKAISGNPEDESIEFVNVADYASQARKHKGASPVAVVYAAGMIVPADSGQGEGVADAQRIADAIADAAEDDHYKVIVLRIDSPGGSPTASETIRREIVRAKEKGKRVIVSMGPVAASGGYWIAANADKIYAAPSSLTGSIGVVMGKADLSGLWRMLDVTWYRIQFGKNAGLWSSNSGFSETERARIDAQIDNTYDAFLTRVAEGRKMDKAKVREIAKGRAWTGAQAQKIGLVDALGGLDDALDDAAKTMGLKDRHDLNPVILPEPETPFEQFIAAINQQVRAGKALQAVVPLMEKASAMWQTWGISERPADRAVYAPVFSSDGR